VLYVQNYAMAMTSNLPGKQLRKSKPRSEGSAEVSAEKQFTSFYEKSFVLAEINAGEIKWLSMPGSGKISKSVYNQLPTITFEAFSESLNARQKDVSLAANRVFGNEDKANRWLNRPLKKLYGKTPLDIAQTGIGAEAVLELLGQIEHGMFA
jgi:hypothetical protein